MIEIPFSRLEVLPKDVVEVTWQDNNWNVKIKNARTITIIYDLEVAKVHYQIQSDCRLIEKIDSQSNFFIETDYFIDEKINFNHLIININSSHSGVINRRIKLAKNSKYICRDIELADSCIESNFEINLIGFKSEADYHLGAICDDVEKEFSVICKHETRKTISKMNSFAISKNRGKIIINGTGAIPKGAKYASTKQQGQIILFDKESRGEIKPELEIDENNIDASHACSLGQVSSDQLFYLLSRGLSYQESRNLISTGYLNKILESIEVEVRLEIIRHIRRKVSVI